MLVIVICIHSRRPLRPPRAFVGEPVQQSVHRRINSASRRQIARALRAILSRMRKPPLTLIPTRGTKVSDRPESFH
jgi:hypothetical protein